MTNDKFTEWLESEISFLQNEEHPSDKAVKYAYKKALQHYRSLSTWIPVTPETMPERYASVIFVIHSPSDEYRHGKVYGGTYSGDGLFSTPGFGCSASAWMPSPLPPAPPQNTQK